MDEQFTIREALLTAMVMSPRIDETNAIRVMRAAASLATSKGWHMDDLGDDYEVTERADALLGWIIGA